MIKYIYGLLILLSVSCYKEKDYIFLDRTNDRLLLEIVSNITTIKANGKDSIYIRAKIPYKVDNTIGKMKFTLSSGTFLESKSNIYETSLSYFNNGIDEFSFADATILSSLDAGQVDLNVQIDKYHFFQPLIFEKNYPDSVIIQTDVLTYKKDPYSQITVMSVLKSGKGNISNGQTSDVQMYNENWVAFGTLISKKIADNNNSEFIFKFSPMPDSAYTGKLYAVAAAIGVGNKTIKDTATLYIIK